MLRDSDCLGRGRGQATALLRHGVAWKKRRIYFTQPMKLPAHVRMNRVKPEVSNPVATLWRIRRQGLTLAFAVLCER
jgi:hypothetical protein